METKEAIGSGQNGKIHKKHRCNQLYAKTDQEGRLRWYRKDSNQAEGMVLLWDILDDDWEIYHEIKDIRPENSGELWEKRESFYHTSGSLRSGGLTLHSDVGTVDMRDVIHGINGWERVFPKVENGSKEAP